MSTFNNLQIIGEFYGVTSNKGDIIVNDGTKNTTLGVGTDNYVLTADSAAPLGIKWALSTGASIACNQCALSSLPVTTNSTIPIPINEFITTPETGGYVVLANFTCCLTNFNRSATFSMYKNGVLVPGSTRIIDSFQAFIRSMISISMIISFSGTDILSIRISTNNLDTDLVIYEGTMTLIRFANMRQISTSNNNFTTNYTSPVTIANTTDTPSHGVYLILFNCMFYVTLNRKTITIGMYKDNLLIPGTSRSINAMSMTKQSFEYHSIVSFTGTETFSIKVNISENDADVVILDRNVIIIAL